MSESIENLVAALERQTAAIHQLAESNRQVVDLLLAEETEEMDAASGGSVYLDGSSKRP